MEKQILEKDYTIDGMDCADCARHLEDVVLKVKGVKSADINFITAKMRVASDESLVSDQLINKAVKTAGYKVKSDRSGIKSSVHDFLPNSHLSVILSGLFIFTVALLLAFRSSELFTSNSKPFSASTMILLIPLTFEAMIGILLNIASSIDIGVPSK